MAETCDGFISHSHAADDLLAPRLQSALQRFAKPWRKGRAVRIFRDESSLSAIPQIGSAANSPGWLSATGQAPNTPIGTNSTVSAIRTGPPSNLGFARHTSGTRPAAASGSPTSPVAPQISTSSSSSIWSTTPAIKRTAPTNLRSTGHIMLTHRQVLHVKGVADGTTDRAV